jgi:Ca-activated chloride channel homolog
METELRKMAEDEIARCEPPQSEAGLGALATEAGNLPLRAVAVEARLVGLLSRTTLRQTFVNPHARPLEATYIFPLPDRAAVTAFRMVVGGRVIEGLLKERGEAREEYEQAIEAGHRASIVEEERPEVFTVRVGNIAPGEEAAVEFTLVGPLPYAEGEATFRFPLVVAPRYIPGAPLPDAPVGDGTAPDTAAVPDASRITPPVLLPGFPSPVRLSLTIGIEGIGLAVENVRSSLHAVAAEPSGGTTVIRLQVGERLDRDFILRFRMGGDGLRTSLVTVADGAPGAGTFLLTLFPPPPAAGKARPRDVAFVLDRSGSMEGWKMVAARRAIGRMIDTLSDEDRFQVLAFDNTIERPTGLGASALEAGSNRNRFRAVEFVSKIEARGGTEMAAPLEEGLDALGGGGAGRRRILVLVTDGQIGNEDQILAALRPRVRDTRIFTVGIDRAVNAGFLTRLASLGSGRMELVESEDRLDEVMGLVHRSIAEPVLTEVTLRLEGAELEPDSLVPSRTPDLFEGSPLVVAGRWRGVRPPSAATVFAAARDGATQKERVAVTPSMEPGVASTWARGRIRELEDLYASRSATEDLERKIVELSIRHHVLCRFTAFVAVDRSERIVRTGMDRSVQPVEPSSRWSAAARSAPAPAQAMELGRIETAPAYPVAKASFIARDGLVDRAPRAGKKGIAPPPRPCMSPSRRPASPSVTRAGTVQGKVSHFSPEAVKGIPLAPSSDVFLLGRMLFELLTGTPLFAASSQFEILTAIAGFDPAVLDHFARSLGPFLPLLRRALARDPSARQADAGVLLAEIEGLVAREGLAKGGEAAELGALVLRNRRVWDPVPSTRVGTYTLRARIAFASRAQIVEAEAADGRRVALEVALPAVDTDEERDRFLDRASLEHPNLVRVLEVGLDGATPFVAAELVEGISLAELARAERCLEPALAAHVIIGVARGLAHLHVLGALARELDAASVLLGIDGAVRLRVAVPAPSPVRAAPRAGSPRPSGRKRSFWK